MSVSSAAASATQEKTSLTPGSIPLFWAQVVGNAGIFVALLLISRGLGPSGRGTIAFVTVTAMVVARLARLGVSEATVVFAAQRPAARPALFANVLLFATGGALVGTLLVVGGLVVAEGIRPPGVGETELAVLAVGMIATALADAGYTFLLGCSRFRPHAVVTMAMSWLYPVLVLGAAATVGLTVARAALAWALVQAVKAGVLIALSSRVTRPRSPDFALLRESLSFGLRAWAGTISSFLNERTDQILITLIATEATTGIYAVAVNSAEVILYLPGAIATALLPLIARSEPHLRAERTLRAFRTLVLVTAFSVVIAAVLGPTLIPLVFGDAFEPSIGAFLLLLPGAFGFSALAVFSNALVGSGSPGRSSLGSLVALVVGLGLDLLLIPRLGASGAAAAASAAFLAGGATALLLYRSRTRFDWRALAVPRRDDLAVLRGLAVGLARRRPASGQAA